MMKRSTTQVGRQMDMLPLEKWIAEERSRSGTMRPLGEVVADVMKGVGRPRTEGGGTAKPALTRDGEERSPRIETGGKGTDAEAPASFAGAIKHRGEPVVNCDILPRTILDRLVPTNSAVAVVIVCTGMPSETEHYAGSETWIEF